MYHIFKSEGQTEFPTIRRCAALHPPARRAGEDAGRGQALSSPGPSAAFGFPDPCVSATSAASVSSSNQWGPGEHDDGVCVGHTQSEIGQEFEQFVRGEVAEVVEGLDAVLAERRQHLGHQGVDGCKFV